MAPSTLSLFLTVLVFAGAQGATKDLDAECNPDPAVDTCTNNADTAILLICDALADPDVCKLQVDQTCNGANAAKCVTGAACDTAGGSPSNQCKCGSGHTATASKICAPDTKTGGACTGGPDAKGNCDDVNAVCSAATDGTCGCKTGTTGVDGQGCTIDDNKFGGSCTTSTINTKGTCDDTNALCSAATDGTCFCKTGYTGTDGAGCAVTANTFGGSCTGGPTAKGTCVDANAKCSAATSGTCGCQDTYSGAIGASCVANNKVGGACTGTAGTKASCEDANALCTSSLCICKDGYDGSAGGTCTKIADNTFGGSCTTGTINTKGTCADTNALCTATTGGFCTCANGYAGIAGSGCALPNKLGGSCTTMTKGTQGTCEDAGATCSAQEDGRCIKSGAKAVVASVTSLVLACIVCLLAIN